MHREVLFTNIHSRLRRNCKCPAFIKTRRCTNEMIALISRSVRGGKMCANLNCKFTSLKHLLRRVARGTSTITFKDATNGNST